MGGANALSSGLLKNPSSLGIGQRRHFGVGADRGGRVRRNPEPRRMATLRFSSPAHWREYGRNKKQRQSPWIPASAGMTIKNEQQNHLPALGGTLWDITSPEGLFQQPLLRGAFRQPLPGRDWLPFGGNDLHAFPRNCRRRVFASTGYAGEAARRPSLFPAATAARRAGIGPPLGRGAEPE